MFPFELPAKNTENVYHWNVYSYHGDWLGV